MQVYIELAIAENFCMDFCLLFGAKLIAKNSARWLRLILASVLGAAFAVIFPLFNLALWASVTVKILSGVLICMVAYKRGSGKGYLKFLLTFLSLTAVLGGALIGIFSLTGISYSGNGYLLSSVPIGIPLLGVLLLVLLARWISLKARRVGKNSVRCHIYVGQLHFESQAFYDSGNRVYLHGEPVSVISQYLILEKMSELCISGGVKIHTVSGSKILEVFTADKVVVELASGQRVYKKIKMGISKERMGEVVLHPDLMEE